MSDQEELSNEEIRERVKAAFSPLRCNTEIWDYEAKLKFTVFNKEEDRSQECKYHDLDLCRDPNYLEETLGQFRSNLKEMGYELD